jgi:hypothetical protein
VAEELAGHQRRGQRAAIDGDERSALARADVVQRAGDDLLAGARLADQQDGASLCAARSTECSSRRMTGVRPRRPASASLRWELDG